MTKALDTPGAYLWLIVSQQFPFDIKTCGFVGAIHCPGCYYGNIAPEENINTYINRQEQSGRLGNQKPGAETLRVGESLMQVSQNVTAYLRNLFSIFSLLLLF